MSAKHTLGPWVFKLNDEPGNCDHIATVAWCEAYCIGRDCGDGYSRNYEHHGCAEDDARLIASAPDMLEALLSFRSLFSLPGWSMNAQGISDAMHKTLAAIAKATGSAA